MKQIGDIARSILPEFTWMDSMEDHTAVSERGIGALADGFMEIVAENAAPKLPMMDAYLSMMRAAALIATGRIGLFEAGGGLRRHFVSVGCP